MKMSGMHVGLIFILAVIATTCGRDDMPKYQTLGDLRILAVLVDKPEANPGDAVTFTPVLSDLNGNGREIGYTVRACIDPGLAFGADPVCTNPDPQSLQTGTHSISAGADSAYTDVVSSFTLTMPDAAVLFAGRTDADRYNGVIYLVQYDIRAANGPAINSFLRIFVSDATKAQKNLNPAAAIDLNGSRILDESATGSAITMPASAANFRAVSPPGSSESYAVAQPDGSLLTRTEQMLHTWFVTDGEFDYNRTDNGTENKWSPPGARPSGRSAAIVVVTRDGRGGSAYKKIVMD